VKTFKLWFRDAAERVVRSFVASFTTLFIAADMIGVNGAVDLSVLKKAGVAGLTASMTTVIAILAKWSSDPGSASFLPPPPAA